MDVLDSLLRVFLVFSPWKVVHEEGRINQVKASVAWWKMVIGLLVEL